MKQVDSELIKSVVLTPEAPNVNYLALVVNNQSDASFIDKTLTGVINLKVDILENSMNVLLSVYITNYDEVIRINLPKEDEVTKNIVKCINDETLTYVFAGYPTPQHPVSLFGLFHPVSY